MAGRRNTRSASTGTGTTTPAATTAPRAGRRQSKSPSRQQRSPARPPQKSVHLPHFQSKDVEFWFLQVEALFRTGGVTDDQSMFDYVIASLDLAAASDIRDILKDPPETNKYATLKKALIDRLAVSEAARIKRTLSNEPMGDRTPSQHLRHLQQVAGSNFSDSVLTSIWMAALPADVKLIVAGDADTLALDKLAAMADRIMDVAGSRRSGTSVHAVSSDPAPSSSEISALTKQINALTQEFRKHLPRSDKPDGPSKAKQPRSKSPAPVRNQPEATDGVCWYHRRFKEKATKCTAPCSWEKESGNGQSQS